MFNNFVSIYITSYLRLKEYSYQQARAGTDTVPAKIKNSVWKYSLEKCIQIYRSARTRTGTDYHRHTRHRADTQRHSILNILYENVYASACRYVIMDVWQVCLCFYVPVRHSVCSSDRISCNTDAPIQQLVQWNQQQQNLLQFLNQLRSAL